MEQRPLRHLEASGVGNASLARWVIFLRRFDHSYWFFGKSCEKPFEDPSFFERNGKPFCEMCFSIILRNEVWGKCCYLVPTIYSRGFAFVMDSQLHHANYGCLFPPTFFLLHLFTSTYPSLIGVNTISKSANIPICILNFIIKDHVKSPSTARPGSWSWSVKHFRVTAQKPYSDLERDPRLAKGQWLHLDWISTVSRIVD